MNSGRSHLSCVASAGDGNGHVLVGNRHAFDAVVRLKKAALAGSMHRGVAAVGKGRLAWESRRPPDATHTHTHTHTPKQNCTSLWEKVGTRQTGQAPVDPTLSSAQDRQKV